MFVKNKSEELFAPVTSMCFYYDSYVIATDFYGNKIVSDKIYPNVSRINDLKDLIKFRDVVNSNINNFSGNTVYLLNDVDLYTVCEASGNSWGRNRFYTSILWNF